MCSLWNVKDQGPDEVRGCCCSNCGPLSRVMAQGVYIKTTAQKGFVDVTQMQSQSLFFFQCFCLFSCIFVQKKFCWTTFIAIFFILGEVLPCCYNSFIFIITIHLIPLSQFPRLLEATTETGSPDGSPNPAHYLPIAPAIVALYDGTADLYE